MGGKISQDDSQDMITAAKNALDILVTKTNFPLKYGYANSKSMNIQADDLAGGGIGMLCLAFDQKNTFCVGLMPTIWKTVYVKKL